MKRGTLFKAISFTDRYSIDNCCQGVSIVTSNLVMAPVPHCSPFNYCNTLFSREENFAKSEFEIFSREDIFANIGPTVHAKISSREHIFPRKYLLAKISCRENIFPRKYSPAKIVCLFRHRSFLFAVTDHLLPVIGDTGSRPNVRSWIRIRPAQQWHNSYHFESIDRSYI